MVAMSMKRRAVNTAMNATRTAPRRSLQETVSCFLTSPAESEVELFSLPVSMLSETDSISTSSIRIASTGSTTSSVQGSASASASSTPASASLISSTPASVSLTSSTVVSSSTATSSPCSSFTSSVSSVTSSSSAFEVGGSSLQSLLSELCTLSSTSPSWSIYSSVSAKKYLF